MLITQLAEFRHPSIAHGVGLEDRIRVEALNRKQIPLTCDIRGEVIRFLAPLSIDGEHFSDAMEILEESITTAGAA